MSLGPFPVSFAREEIALRKVLRLRRRPLPESNPPRCPVCRLPLVLRMGRRGPYYSCGCKGKA